MRNITALLNTKNKNKNNRNNSTTRTRTTRRTRRAVGSTEHGDASVGAAFFLGVLGGQDARKGNGEGQKSLRDGRRAA